MTEQEAINYFNNVTIDTNIGFENMCTTSDLINISVKALEKQIPRKINQNIVNGKMARWCPNGCEITYVTQHASVNYCPYCGQAIKL